jgi:hypothetical protein
MEPSIPVFDFNTPWVALIQIALFVALPQLVGLVTDKLTDAKVKTYLLGALTLVSTILTFLLDFAVADAWSTFEPVALVNIIVNFAITWAAANAFYKGVLVPTGASEAAQESNVIQLFGPSEERLAAAAAAPKSARAKKAA